MKTINAIAAIALCFFVWEAESTGSNSISIMDGVSMPLWIAIPITAICAITAIMDVVRKRRPLAKS